LLLQHRHHNKPLQAPQSHRVEEDLTKLPSPLASLSVSLLLLLQQGVFSYTCVTEEDAQ
jgi:hypothetical protein